MELDGRVRADLAATTRFSDIRLLAETGSTNSVAMAADGDAVVVTADYQTAGRGRLDRTWEARPGDGLLVSVRLRTELPVARRHLITAATALAARSALDAVAGVRAAIKWPNDLLVGEAKLAGILAEAAGDAVVVGMGLNVHGGPPGAAVLDRAAGRRVRREALLESWLRALDRRLGDWETVAADYRDGCSTVGRRVSVELRAGRFVEGVAVAVDDDGRLVVRTDSGGREVVAVGDVTHLR